MARLSQHPFELSASPRQPLVFGGAPIGGLYEPVSDADAAATLRFTLRHPAVTAAVVGARPAAEISTDASYLTRDIPDELFAALATVLRH